MTPGAKLSAHPFFPISFMRLKVFSYQSLHYVQPKVQMSLPRLEMKHAEMKVEDCRH